MTGERDDAPEQKCSRAGCAHDARWNVNWRNPRIHDVNRVKVWVACDDHVDYLRDYLAARDLPVEVTEFGVTLDRLDA